MNIDGSLDEPQWNSAFEIKDFYETSPFTLKKNELQTTALIFSNKDGIYVGFKNVQSNESMLSRKTLRDEINSLSDKNSINIDFDGDGNKAFILAINLGDSLFDAIKTQAGEFIEVTLEVLNPEEIEAYDQAPVKVFVTTEISENVLYVPVNALLALAEGGYALEIYSGELDSGTFEGESGVDTSYVAVEIGVFTDGFVEVKGNISEGQIVVVPR